MNYPNADDEALLFQFDFELGDYQVVDDTVDITVEVKFKDSTEIVNRTYQSFGYADGLGGTKYVWVTNGSVRIFQAFFDEMYTLNDGEIEYIKVTFPMEDLYFAGNMDNTNFRDFTFTVTNVPAENPEPAVTE